MGKGRRKNRKKNNERWVRRRPDEAFSRGPLLVERFGRFVRMMNTSTPEQHAAFLIESKKANRQLLSDLATEVAALQGLVARYDPLELMNRAAYVLLTLFMGAPAESELSSEESFSLPTVEYLQYLIARTPTAPGRVAPTEQQWDELWSQAVGVLRLTQTHLITRKTTTEPPTAIDDLRFMIDSQRLAIRVDRYDFFRIAHLQSALGPYAAAIQSVWGATVDEIIAGLDQIAAYQKVGVIGRYEAMRDASEALMVRLAKAGYAVTPGASPAEIERTQAALKLDEFREDNARAQEAARLALTPALFDITDLTSLPKPFISLLSVRPGESILTSLTGPDHDDLSPLSPSVLHHKPFMEIEGRYYTFFHSGFEDRIADIIEADLFARLPAQVSDLANRRGERLESDARELLVSLLCPDFVHSNVFYPNPDDAGNLTELDLLIGVDDVLILVEAKAGGIDAAARRGAPESLAQALSDLIVEGQRQSERAEKYIRSAEDVAFFDETGTREVRRLRHSAFRRILRIVVTREELGWVGAKIAILSVLEPSLSVSHPWHVSIDDLRVIEHLFQGDNIRFVHYLEVRLLAAAEEALRQADELEHVGLYNKMNYYHELPVRDVSHMTFDASYMLDIDRYFTDKSAGIDSPRPGQSMPPGIRKLIDGLGASRVAGRLEVGSLVLSLASDARRGLAKGLATLDAGLLQGRRRSFRIAIDGVGLSMSYATGANWDEELRRSAVQMAESELTRWVVAQLQPDASPYTVTRVEIITPGRFREKDLISARTAVQRKTRELIATEQPGRNDPCPCGSKKKFKRCHGA